MDHSSASHHETRFEAATVLSQVMASVYAVLFLAALIAGWTIYESGLAGLQEFGQEGLMLLAVMLVAVPAVLVGFSMIFYGTWQSVILRESELVLIRRSGGAKWRIPLREISEVSYHRSRAVVRVKFLVYARDPSRQKTVRLGAPPFEEDDIDQLYAVLGKDAVGE